MGITQTVLETSPHPGVRLLQDPLHTKGTAFTLEERRELGLLGLLPTATTTVQEQVSRCWNECSRKVSDIDKHIYLRSLQDRNEVLFYRLLVEHLEESLPLVYTPTVAEACAHFSDIYRRPRGLYLAYPYREHLVEMLRNRPQAEVHVIVVTDGQRILGIGDQGVGGMGIPIGKLSLYTLIGGIAPARTLPIILDVGTDNAELLDNPDYLGWRHHRVDEDEYYAFVGDFVAAVRSELPGVLLQWEDFASTHALPLLERYRDELLTFNDDIQGTAAVAVGALRGATRAAGTPLRDQSVVMLGAGSAGTGVLAMIAQEMVDEGLTPAQAHERCWMLDKDGLLTDDRRELTPAQRAFAQPRQRVAGWTADGRPGLAEVVHHVQPGILIGLSTAAGAFSERIVRRMAQSAARPIIFPLSNPTSNAEARPADLDAWTGGRALMATGSPFGPVSRDGREIRVSQCNNVYVFPAVGLGVIAAHATRVTDAMLRAAARALGDASPALSDLDGALLPAMADIRDVAAEIAVAVGLQAVADGVAPANDETGLRAAIEATRWTPEYVS
jgi:malate dehydrogenase (oxaloacetate-decarboxylating)